MQRLRRRRWAQSHLCSQKPWHSWTSAGPKTAHGSRAKHRDPVTVGPEQVLKLLTAGPARALQVLYCSQSQQAAASRAPQRNGSYVSAGRASRGSRGPPRPWKRRENLWLASAPWVEPPAPGCPRRGSRFVMAPLTPSSPQGWTTPWGEWEEDLGGTTLFSRCV